MQVAARTRFRHRDCCDRFAGDESWEPTSLLRSRSEVDDVRSDHLRMDRETWARRVRIGHLLQGHDSVAGVNVIGMRRAGLTTPQIDAVRRAFKIIFHEGLPVPAALDRVEQELGGVDVVAELVAFIRQSPRGINPARDRFREAASILWVSRSM